MNSAPLQRLFDLIRASDCSKRERMTGLMGWQNNTTAPIEVKDLAERLEPHIHDLSTHYSSWRSFITERIDAIEHDAGDSSYERHELKVFDQVFMMLAGVTVSTTEADLQPLADLKQVMAAYDPSPQSPTAAHADDVAATMPCVEPTLPAEYKT